MVSRREIDIYLDTPRRLYVRLQAQVATHQPTAYRRTCVRRRLASMLMPGLEGPFATSPRPHGWFSRRRQSKRQSGKRHLKRAEGWPATELRDWRSRQCRYICVLSTSMASPIAPRLSRFRQLLNLLPSLTPPAAGWTTEMVHCCSQAHPQPCTPPLMPNGPGWRQRELRDLLMRRAEGKQDMDRAAGRNAT